MAQNRDRGLLENFTRKVFLPEESDVQEFLKHSEDFLKMSDLALNAKSTSWTNGVLDRPQEQRMVEDIKKSSNFTDVLNATSQLAQIPKAAGMLFFLGGYFNQELNFGYYALQLREKALKTMTSKGYTVQPPRNSF